jgi:integrase
VHIVQQLQMNGEFDSPKSHRSSRAITLPTFVVEALRRHRIAQTERRLMCGEAWHGLDLVVERGDGLPLRPISVSKRFATVMRAADIALTFHGLRHAYASLMLAGGVNLKVTSGLVGHSSIGITADLYTHGGLQARTRSGRHS